MTRRPLFFWLLLPPALVLCALTLSLVVFLLSLASELVRWMAAVLVVVLAAWFFFARGRGTVVPGSESSLSGRQSSKEGLL